MKAQGGKTGLRDLPERIKLIVQEILHGEIPYNRLAQKLINAAKIAYVASRKFMLDDCFTKASSIAYTTIISLIPTLTVGLTFFSIFSGMSNKKEEIFRKISLFMLEHNIKLNIDPIIESISSLIENAGKIGGIGAVVMGFTATAVLRTLEQSLNDVWRVQRSRPIALRLVYYWAALTLGPLMLIAATTAATQILSFFSSPAYNSAFVAPNGTLWIGGGRGTVLHSRDGGLSRRPLEMSRIDFDNQAVYEYDASAGGFVEQDFRIEDLDIRKAEFTDVYFSGASGWIVGKNGIMLRTADGGASWSLAKWGSFDFTGIRMLGEKRGFASARNGYLFKTEDGGASWGAVEIENFNSNLSSIASFGTTIIIAGDRGAVLQSQDAGATWRLRYPNEAKRNKRSVNLNKVFLVDEATAWIVGDEGIILLSENGGASWRDMRYLEKSYTAVYFSGRRTGWVGGKGGIRLSTANGGERWERGRLHTSRINCITSYGAMLLAVGEEGMIMRSEDRGRSWKGTRGGNLIGALLNFFGPFILIWVLFLLTYIILPNTRVPFKPAAIGASFTAAIWVVFILLFIVYVKSFASGTVAIYGGLAAIPLFLLMVYTSTLIILYGAEISYTLTHPHSYRVIRKAGPEGESPSVYHGIAILHSVYRKFEAGRGPSRRAELLRIVSGNNTELERLVGLFKGDKLVVESENGELLPTTSSATVPISRVIDLVHGAGLSIPGTVSSDPLKRYLKGLFESMGSSRSKILKGIALSDVIRKTGQ